jgi:two-component system, OmpR family, sensor histidine kinase MprB
MSFRLRVTLAAAAAVLVVAMATSVVVYALVRRDLRGQIDDSLQRGRPPPILQIDRLREANRQPNDVADLDDTLFGDRFLQVADEQGEVVVHYTEAILPVPDEVRRLAARPAGTDLFYDSEVAGTPVRVYAVAADGVVVQFGRSLVEVNESLRQLVGVLAGLSAVGLVLAVVLGRLVAAAAVAPVHRLSAAADGIARTGDLSRHIEVSGRDELAQLAAGFNAMLDALDASLSRQRHLVADASHELRTPLASVRTNVEVLQRATHLDPSERDQLLRDIVAQIEELTRLVEDLVELARGDDAEDPFETVDLAEVVADVVGRARRNRAAVDFELIRSPSPSTIRGAPSRVDRAVSNLVDNAAKWSPAGGLVRIEVVGAAVAVTDEGPGIDPVDLPHVFDRFYRSAQARSLPGSGLGLAIVKQVADSHQARVSVDRGPRGGARFVLRFPPSLECTERDASASHR